MTNPVVGIVHPGEMGAALAGELVSAGHEVLWASQGRGPETYARAADGGLIDAGTVDELASRTDILLSVCPPHAALDVARSVPGYTGTFVDANADCPRPRARSRASSSRAADALSTARSSVRRRARRGTPGCSCPAGAWPR